jgi:hypothetical protein
MPAPMIDSLFEILPNLLNLLSYMIPLLIISAIVGAVIGFAYHIAVWKGWIPRKKMDDPKI